DGVDVHVEFLFGAHDLEALGIRLHHAIFDAIVHHLGEVTGAYRINYAIMGNSEPVLHAHIVPRYLSEPEELLHGLPWSYPQAQMDAVGFDPVRDQALMQKLAQAIQKRQ
ncbi:MAG TPA: hypothetical protein PLA25_04795, partial [Anaerolineaceae bacterium]|nr:hypothetical protein [Anaerolineaceae bacterium]